MGRLTGWEAFVTRWKMFADAVSGVVQSAQQAGSTQLTAAEAARLDVALKKAVRARQILQQLQAFTDKQQQLELRHRPTVQQLPTLLQQLRPEALSQAAEFAVMEGMRGPILQVTGSSAAVLAATSAQQADPFGIRVAFRPGHPMALLTWQQYIPTVTRMSRVLEQQLQGPALEALAAFNRERRVLVQELQALRQQLEPEVDIPQLQPLRDETERLDHLLGALGQLQDAHMAMLAKDLSRLDLQLLELKLKLRLGEAYQGSALQGALSRLKQLHIKVEAGERLPAAAAAQLDGDLKTLIQHTQQQQKLAQVVEANIQRHAQAVFERLRQLPSSSAAPAASSSASFQSAAS